MNDEYSPICNEQKRAAGRRVETVRGRIYFAYARVTDRPIASVRPVDRFRRTLFGPARKLAPRLSRPRLELTATTTTAIVVFRPTEIPIGFFFDKERRNYETFRKKNDFRFYVTIVIISRFAISYARRAHRLPLFVIIVAVVRCAATLMVVSRVPTTTYKSKTYERTP